MSRSSLVLFCSFVCVCREYLRIYWNSSICAFTGSRVFAHLLELEYLRIYWNSSICAFTGTRVFAHLLELEYLRIYWNCVSSCLFALAMLYPVVRTPLVVARWTS
uniref:Secreted protein n=1 Tax=Cacopsylla melanoneura TaxID=428564 RepID=A0A8D8R5A6_9HEMI